MKPVINTLSVIACLLIFALPINAQLSSSDIRNASGNGPYPFYFTLQYSKSTSINSFKNFANNFYDPNDIRFKALRGIDANIGVVVNEKNIRFSVESGYRWMVKNINQNGLKLKMTEEVASLRIGYRFNILYPVTAQIQSGPIFYHMSSIKIDSTNNRVSAAMIGNSAFKKGNKLWYPVLIIDSA